LATNRLELTKTAGRLIFSDYLVELKFWIETFFYQTNINMLKNINLAEIPWGFVAFIGYVLTLKAIVGMWVMQLVTGS